MTATKIYPGLWQGGYTEDGAMLAQKRIDTLVLCAAELQPPDALYPGIEVLRCPFDDFDVEPTPALLVDVSWMARSVVQRLRRGMRVLVTCAQGLNRSGFVVAHVLTKLNGQSGSDAIRWIQRRRKGALFNRAFVRALERIPEDPELQRRAGMRVRSGSPIA